MERSFETTVSISSRHFFMGEVDVTVFLEPVISQPVCTRECFVTVSLYFLYALIATSLS